MSGLTGAGYTVEVAEALGRGLRGVIVLRVGKDRPGHVRGQSGPMRKTDRTQEAARVVIDSTIDPDHPLVTVEPWRGHDAPAGTSRAFRPTGLMEHVSEALEGASEPLSFRGIDERVTGKREHIRFALDVLINEGTVSRTDGPRGAQIHTLTQPYQQRLDPLSDLYVEPGHSQAPKTTVSVPLPYTGERGTHTQPLSGTVGARSGHGQKCGLCGAEIETPGRGICSRCDAAQTSKPHGIRAAS